MQVFNQKFILEICTTKENRLAIIMLSLTIWSLKFNKDWWQKNQIFIHDICSLWL